MLRPTSRISVGFHRIGVALGTPFLLCGLLVGAWNLWLMSKSGPAPQTILSGTHSSPPNQSELVELLDEPKNFFDQFDEKAPPNNSGQAFDFSLPALLIAFGCLVYAACRALGWVINGFVGA